MTDPATPTNAPMTHEEATELSGLYVLDALEVDERAAVEAHLASCGQEHPEFDEVGGLMPALASVVEPVDAPPQLKSQVMAAYARETADSAAAREDARSVLDGRLATPPAGAGDVAEPRRLADADLGWLGHGCSRRADLGRRRRLCLWPPITTQRIRASKLPPCQMRSRRTPRPGRKSRSSATATATALASLPYPPTELPTWSPPGSSLPPTGRPTRRGSSPTGCRCRPGWLRSVRTD